MPESNHTTIMAQLASTAPNIHELLRTRPARIRASVASGDVVNGYGFSLSMTLTVEVLTEKCDHCGETQFTAPVFDCRRHRFTRDWQHIADTSAPSLVEALTALDAAVYAWTQKVDRRAA